MAHPFDTPPPGAPPTLPGPERTAPPAEPSVEPPTPPVGDAAPTGPRRHLPALDPPMVPFALAGLAAFAVAGLALLPFRDWLAAHGHTDWLWTCVGGFLVGIPGLITMIRHDANRRRRRALEHPEVTER